MSFRNIYIDLVQKDMPLDVSLEQLANLLYLARNHKSSEEQVRNLDCAIELLNGMHRYHRFYD